MSNFGGTWNGMAPSNQSGVPGASSWGGWGGWGGLAPLGWESQGGSATSLQSNPQGFQAQALQFGLWMQAQLQLAYSAGYQAGQRAGSVPAPMAGTTSGFAPGWTSGDSQFTAGQGQIQNQSQFNTPVSGPLAHLFMNAAEFGANGTPTRHVA